MEEEEDRVSVCTINTKPNSTAGSPNTRLGAQRPYLNHNDYITHKQNETKVSLKTIDKVPDIGFSYNCPFIPKL